MSSQNWPSTLPAPLLEGHRLASSSRKYVTEMETGRKRIRRQFEELRKIAEVQWAFTADQFEQFRSFFQDTLEGGTLGFLLNLYGEEQEVKFLSSQYSFDHSDNLFRVSSVLEVFPIPPPVIDISFTYSISGTALRDTGARVGFGFSLDKAPLVERDK